MIPILQPKPEEPKPPDAEEITGCQVGAGVVDGKPAILLMLTTQQGTKPYLMSPDVALAICNQLTMAKRDAITKARAARQ